MKLSLPENYKEEKDDHGKGNMAFLDTSFDFLNFDAGELEEGDNNTPTTFTKDLRTNLVASIAINESFEDIIENNGKDLSFFTLPSIDNSPGSSGYTLDGILQLCQGDCDDDDDCAEGLECFQRGTGGPQPTGCIGTPTIDNDYCVVKDEGLRLGVIPYFKDISDIQKVLVGGKFTGFLNTKKNQWITPHPTLAEPHRRFTRSSLDASIAAIFGEKTSLGQVCSYAQGLKDGNVTTVPGFCCLDAPYEADYWGELVRNILLCKLKSTK